MTCRLCKRDAKLLQSHIIPEYFYKAVYENRPNRRFSLFSSLPTAGKPRILQKGLRERLLCCDCETKLSRFERYASLVFRGNAGVSWKREGDLVFLEGISYNEFKLFALSILWRAGISSLPIFSHVNLGPHQERIREMLLSENPGPSEKYPFLMNPVTMKGKLVTEFIIEPTEARVDGHRVYRFIFGGFAWLFVVSGHRPSFVIREVSLSEEGNMILAVTDLRELKFLKRFFRKLGAKRFGAPVS